MQESPREVAPLVDPAMLADPVYTQRVMTGRQHAFGPRAAKNVDEVGRAEALPTLSQPRDAGQELPRLSAPVLDGPRFAAVITRSARPRERLTEVTQLHRTTALGRVRELQHLAQLLAGDALLVLQGLAGRVHLLLDQELGRADIGAAEIQDAVGRIAITPRPARFLVIAFQGAGQIEIHDPAHVRLVDAHAERNRRDDDLQIVANEGVLSITAGGGGESCVVWRGADALCTPI